MNSAVKAFVGQDFFLNNVKSFLTVNVGGEIPQVTQNS